LNLLLSNIISNSNWCLMLAPSNNCSTDLKDSHQVRLMSDTSDKESDLVDSRCIESMQLFLQHTTNVDNLSENNVVNIVGGNENSQKLIFQNKTYLWWKRSLHHPYDISRSIFLQSYPFVKWEHGRESICEIAVL
jgi:hypothetical protein